MRQMEPGKQTTLLDTTVHKASHPWLIKNSYSDPNCGAAYDAAIDDFALGLIDGCSQTNPTNAAVAPTNSPSCS